MTKKRAKTENISSITIGYMNSRKGSTKTRDVKRMKILLDSGCGATLINKNLIGKLKTTKEKKTKWKTKAGNFATERKCKLILPYQHYLKKLKLNCYVDESSPNSCLSDLIIGRDLMLELGIDICFSTAEIIWNNASISMHPADKLSELNINKFEQEILFCAHDPGTTDAGRIQNIVESKYCSADLSKIANECEIREMEQKGLFVTQASSNDR